MNKDQNDRAACLGMDPDLFFPEKSDRVTAAEARAVCATCPVDVQTACLKLSLKEPHTGGIWAGTNSRERREFRRLAKVTKNCGRCGGVFPLTLFPRNAQKPDGRHAWCRGCMNDYSRQRRAAA